MSHCRRRYQLYHDSGFPNVMRNSYAVRQVHCEVVGVDWLSPDIDGRVPGVNQLLEIAQ